MKPEQLLEPDNWPDELKWVAAEHRLHPDDPVFLLLAWHWNRMKACEDTVQLALTELKAAVDRRAEQWEEGAETLAEVNASLGKLQASLAAKPAEVEQALRAPVENAVRQLQEVERSLVPVAQKFQVAQRRQLLAVFLIGVTLGVLAAAIALVA